MSEDIVWTEVMLWGEPYELQNATGGVYLVRLDAHTAAALENVRLCDPAAFVSALAAMGVKLTKVAAKTGTR